MGSEGCGGGGGKGEKRVGRSNEAKYAGTTVTAGDKVKAKETRERRRQRENVGG